MPWPIATRSRIVAEGEIAFIDSLCLARAPENNLVVACRNAADECGAEGLDAVVGGRFHLANPVDKMVVQREANDEEVLLGRVRIG